MHSVIVAFQTPFYAQPVQLIHTAGVGFYAVDGLLIEGAPNPVGLAPSVVDPDDLPASSPSSVAFWATALVGIHLYRLGEEVVASGQVQSRSDLLMTYNQPGVMLMSLTVELEKELEQRVRQEAEKRGLQADEYVREIVKERLPEETDEFAALVQSWIDEGDEEEQRATLKAIQQGLNEHHSSCRVMFR